MTRVAVLGAGAWGTAIAAVLAARLEVALWARDPAQAAALTKARCNERYLPGIALPGQVRIESDLPLALQGAQSLKLIVDSPNSHSIGTDHLPYDSDSYIAHYRTRARFR